MPLGCLKSEKCHHNLFSITWKHQNLVLNFHNSNSIFWVLNYGNKPKQAKLWWGPQKVIIELSNWEMSDEYTQTKPSLTNPTIVSLFLKPILSSFYGLGFIAFAFGLELQSGPSLFSESSGTNDIFFLCSLPFFLWFQVMWVFLGPYTQQVRW